MSREEDRRKRLQEVLSLVIKHKKIETEHLLGRICEYYGLTLRKAQEYIDVLVYSHKVYEDGRFIRFDDPKK